MKTTHYLRNEANIGNTTYPPGTVIATIDSPDGVDIQRVINALARGFTTTTPPKTPAGPPVVQVAAHPLRPAPTASATPAPAPATPFVLSPQVKNLIHQMVAPVVAATPNAAPKK